MSRLRRSLSRVAPVFLIVALQGGLLTAPNVALSQAVVTPESPFASVNQPIGVAASPGRLLVTRPFCGNPRQVVSISPTGKVSVFATLPNRPASEGNPGACFEDYLTIVPAPASFQSIAGFPTPNNGFTSNDVFVTQGNNIIRIKFDGSSVTLFATLPSSDVDNPCPTTQSGITFDNVGIYGDSARQLIVVCANGNVFTVNSAGSFAFQETVGGGAAGPYEGPVVAPNGVFSNCLVVAADNAPVESSPNGEVFTNSACEISVPVPLAEGVTIVPTTKCTYGLTPGDTYFTAIFGVGGNTIDELPQSAFAGLGGDALVPSESNSGEETSRGITRITSGPSTYIFRPFFANHQGSAFADCHVPVIVKIKVTQNANGTVTLQIFGEAGRFDPSLINVNTLTFGNTGTETPANLNCVLPKHHPDNESSQGALHEHQGTATCTFTNNLTGGHPGIFKATFTDPTGGGDGEAEGGGG